MGYLSKAILLLPSIISLSANADSELTLSKECKKAAPFVKKYEHLNLKGYQCGNEIQDLKRFKLSGLKLLAALAPDEYTSSAYYTSNKIFDGVISYPEGPNDTYAFDTKNGHFSFGGGSNEKSLATIKYPSKLAKACKSGELKANAKMRIKFVHDVKADNCQEGSWVYDYEIISVGKYSCRP